MTPMERRQLITVGVVACAIVAGLLAAIPRAATTLPARLTDHEFWQLSTDASEPDGYFRSDNLTSNETGFLRVVTELVARTKPGQVYLGVGPEQNFSYIAATRPAFAIIFDIRRGNLLLQLMYKASSSSPGIAPTSSRCCSRGRVPNVCRSIRPSPTCLRRLGRPAPTRRSTSATSRPSSNGS